MLSNELQIYINSPKQPSISTILTKKHEGVSYALRLSCSCKDIPCGGSPIVKELASPLYYFL